MSLKNETNENILCGGEDISALVVDLGFNTSKIGHNQEDTPRIFLNSICGENIYEEERNISELEKKNYYKKLKFPLNLYNRNENVRIKPLFDRDKSNNVILNSDVFERILEYSIEGVEVKRIFECTDEIINPIKLGGLNLKFDEHPILLSESNIHNNKIREQITELLFEKYNVPALYFAKKAKLTSFSLGRSNSLVIDIGFSSLNINPVYEGYVLQKNSFEYNVGGDYFDKLIYDKLKKDNINIIPYFCSQKYNGIDVYKNIHSSYKEEAILDIIRYMKESVCKIRIENDIKSKENNINNLKGNENDNLNNNMNDPPKEEFFELPDGYKINVEKYKYDIAENLFKSIPSENNFKGLPQSIINCVISTDVDIRKDLLQSIILTGGSSLFPGLVERLFNSLREKECFSQSLKLKILNMTSLVENKYSSWLGGSILASLGTFQQLWISKKEYLDYGHKIIFDRCF
ncbi:actin-related protein, putative [Plasmodium relictum]|uniref:Actin-related protein, putative n=1 Tax=Plasmodium relictum TaxID=85471 RepID=A0A1J1HDE5_PLARL|nr:actin-related protein, putative [Plasmodium relictum]CRH03915.1 actin-related protein, putative [Plasmodium relictum]